MYGFSSANPLGLIYKPVFPVRSKEGRPFGGHEVKLILSICHAHKSTLFHFPKHWSITLLIFLYIFFQTRWSNSRVHPTIVQCKGQSSCFISSALYAQLADHRCLIIKFTNQHHLQTLQLPHRTKALVRKPFFFFSKCRPRFLILLIYDSEIHQDLFHLDYGVVGLFLRMNYTKAVKNLNTLISQK